MRGRYAKKRAERLARANAVEMLGKEPPTETKTEKELAREYAKLRNFAQNYGMSAKEIVDALRGHYRPNPSFPKGWTKP